jgi:hypothetical protein
MQLSVPLSRSHDEVRPTTYRDEEPPVIRRIRAPENSFVGLEQRGGVSRLPADPCLQPADLGKTCVKRLVVLSRPRHFLIRAL